MYAFLLSHSLSGRTLRCVKKTASSVHSNSPPHPRRNSTPNSTPQPRPIPTSRCDGHQIRIVIYQCASIRHRSSSTSHRVPHSATDPGLDSSPLSDDQGQITCIKSVIASHIIVGLFIYLHMCVQHNNNVLHAFPTHRMQNFPHQEKLQTPTDRPILCCSRIFPSLALPFPTNAPK